MPLHDFATVHPTLIQTLQGSSAYLSLLDISFVSASRADGEGLTTTHVCLHISGHPWEIREDHSQGSDTAVPITSSYSLSLKVWTTEFYCC